MSQPPMTNTGSLIDELVLCTAPAGSGKTHAIARHVAARPGCSLVRIDVAEDWKPFDLAAKLNGAWIDDIHVVMLLESLSVW